MAKIPGLWIYLSYALFCIVLHQYGFNYPFDLNVPVLLKYALSMCIGMTIMIYWNQAQLLYVPHPDKSVVRSSQGNPLPLRSPLNWDLGFENVYLVSGPNGPLIHGWFIPQPDGASKTAPTILFFHGNSGNIGARLPNFVELYYSVQCNIFAIDYRGYGESQGEPDETGLNCDADAALTHLLEREDIDPNKIFLFGRSLGGAVALSLAARVATRNKRKTANGTTSEEFTFRGVMLENTFTSIAELAVVVLPILNFMGATPRLISFILHNQWKSLEALQKVPDPVLLLCGLKDELIPPEQMNRLATTARQRHNAITVVRTYLEGGHNDTPIKGGSLYYSQVREFVHQTCDCAPPHKPVVPSKRAQEFLALLTQQVMNMEAMTETGHT
jgi:fermentation-respiration switch protein FrsA (DUF1100 family)